MFIRLLLIALSLALLSAEGRVSTASAGEAGIGHGPPSPDTDTERAISLLEGRYAGDGQFLNVGRVDLMSLGPAVYLESGRFGDPLNPRRQQFWIFQRRDGDQLFARIYEPPGRLNRRNVLIGAWAAPDYMIRPDYRELDLLGDVRVEVSSNSVRFSNEHPIAVDFDGAVDAYFDVTIDESGAAWGFRGIGAEGEIAWGDDPHLMERLPDESITTIRDNGLVVLDFVTGEGIEAEIRDSVALHWRAYLITGQLLHDSRTPEPGASGANPFIRELRLDNGMPQGWNLGLTGMKVNGKRRVIVPPHLAYGPEGRAPIPPNAWIVYDFDLMSIKDNTTGDPDDW